MTITNIGDNFIRKIGAELHSPWMSVANTVTSQSTSSNHPPTATNLPPSKNATVIFKAGSSPTIQRDERRKCNVNARQKCVSVGHVLDSTRVCVIPGKQV